ncbi:MAG: hypothetical protein WC341_14290 [Bacteroidales bacterium]|jgi:hypothetical protein
MGRTLIEIKTIRAGQPRPYADSAYEAEIIFKNWWESTTGEREGSYDPDEETVKKVASLLFRRFVEKPEWHDPRLERISKTGPGKWSVLVVEPYLD